MRAHEWIDVFQFELRFTRPVSRPIGDVANAMHSTSRLVVSFHLFGGRLQNGFVVIVLSQRPLLGLARLDVLSLVGVDRWSTQWNFHALARRRIGPLAGLGRRCPARGQTAFTGERLLGACGLLQCVLHALLLLLVEDLSVLTTLDHVEITEAAGEDRARKIGLTVAKISTVRLFQI